MPRLGRKKRGLPKKPKNAGPCRRNKALAARKFRVKPERELPEVQALNAEIQRWMDELIKLRQSLAAGASCQDTLELVASPFRQRCIAPERATCIGRCMRIAEGKAPDGLPLLEFCGAIDTNEGVAWLIGALAEGWLFRGETPPSMDLFEIEPLGDVEAGEWVRRRVRPGSGRCSDVVQGLLERDPELWYTLIWGHPRIV